ncbi:hypothetical protein ACTNDZ_13445 [Selenomonas montiformis]|uniref:hypothetical protein n=1 Tax=Selenomonas montiformis TaxID=2652285 RepID=UPI003F8BECF0
MGLDQFAYRVMKQNVIDDLTFKQEEIPEDGNDMDFDYWRKFRSLNDWCYDLYRKKGGTGEFNCDNVRLTKDDLDDLYRAAQRDEFYQDTEERDMEYAHLMNFIQNAKQAIAEGDAVYYSNWW